MSIETANTPHALEALEVKELRALLSQAFEIRSTPAFFQLTCENITPLLLSHPSLEECRQEWMTEKEQYQRRSTQYRKQAEREVKNMFSEFKDRCPVSSPQYPLLLPLFRQIEEVLSHKQPYFFSPYYIIIYHLLKEACSTLFTENHRTLIRDWIKVVWSENLGMNFIKEFLFCPSVAEVMKLQEAWNWNRPMPVWVVWEYLYTACWAWKTPAKYFARKSIIGEGPVQSRHNMELIELHTVWCKMQAIRKGNPEKETFSLFTVDRFSGYLQRIVEQILASKKCDSTEGSRSPYSLKLSLETDRLLLTVEWMKGGRPISYALRRFYQESESYEFIRDLIEADPGERVYIPTGGGQNAAKLTTRAGLKGALEKVFIKDRGRSWCILNSKTVYISPTLSHLKKLKEEVLCLPLA